MTREFFNYIDGKWIPAASGETLASHNPATGELIGAAPASDARDVARAVTAAANAFEKWRKTPAPRRAEIIHAVADLVRARKQTLGELLTREMGKVLPEALGDVQEAVDMGMYMAGEGRRLNGLLVPSELPNKWAMAIRDPLGVVGLITPWNFPIAVPSWKIFPALLTGNTIVWKPAEDTPVLAVEFVKIFEEAGLPPGVLNLVTGYGVPAGEALVEHPQVKMISFTGSNEIGKQIAVRGAQLGKRVSLELGGKNAIIVLDDADLDLALDGIIWSAFGTSGQRCTATSRVIVTPEIHSELAERVADRASKLRLGNGLLPTTDVGPLINRDAVNKVHQYTELGVSEGAALLAGGARGVEGDLAQGHFYKPTVFDRVTPTMRLAQEEIFGPSLAILRAHDMDEAIRLNNGVNFGLSASIYTSNVNKAFEAMRDLTTGIVYINAGTIGSEVQLPFGGTRGTGNGHREGGGPPVLDAFTEWKSIYVDYSGKLQRAQIDTDALVQ
ncbi:aldehyde dehydrogenase family protein [Anaerolineae bacterium CFX7]|nr:aldehyde dehydrogenase family protein [Anaerolineae bacterium CFX7]